MKSNVYKEVRIELTDCLNLSEWGLICNAARVGDEEVIGFGWTSFTQPEMPVLTVTFKPAEATSWLRMLYTAYASLSNTESYLNEIGISHSHSRPTSLNIGPVESHGAILMVADWEDIPYARFVVLSSSQELKSTISLDVQDISVLIQVTTSAFEALDWGVPD